MKKLVLFSTLVLNLAFLTGCDSRFSGKLAYASGRLLGYIVAIALFAALIYGLMGLFAKNLSKKARWGWAFGVATIATIFLTSLGQTFKG